MKKFPSRPTRPDEYNHNVLPVPKLPPPPEVAARLAAADRVKRAWKAHDTVLAMSGGDRDLADRAYQQIINQKEKDHGE